nr:MAG TPA: hypothetical protein [Microviridae sp.]
MKLNLRFGPQLLQLLLVFLRLLLKYFRNRKS